MRDPYTVLGRGEIRRHGRDQEGVPQARQEIPSGSEQGSQGEGEVRRGQQAYEILGDETKRAAFDRGEIDGEGKPRHRGFEGFGGGGGGSPSYEFHDFGGGSPFGRGFRSSRCDGRDRPERFLLRPAARRGARLPSGAVRGEDVTASVTVPLEEAVSGGTARVVLPTGRTLDVKVPAGIEDGKAIRLKGQGQPGPNGGPRGDAIVTVQIAPHKLFEVDGRDLRLDLPVTLYEAVLGGKITVPTLDGAVEITLPPGANRGRTLRLRGKGLPDRPGHWRSAGHAEDRAAGARRPGTRGNDAALAGRKTLRPAGPEGLSFRTRAGRRFCRSGSECRGVVARLGPDALVKRRPVALEPA